MKGTIIIISIHLMVSSFFRGLECLTIQVVGKQASPLDRFCNN